MFALLPPSIKIGGMPIASRIILSFDLIDSAKSNSLKLIFVRASTSSPPSKYKRSLASCCWIISNTPCSHHSFFYFSQKEYLVILSTNPGTAPFLKKLSWKFLMLESNCIVLYAGFSLGTPL